MLEPDSIALTIGIAKLKQIHPHDGRDGAARIQADRADRADLGVGDKQLAAVRGQAAGLGQGGLHQRPVNPGLLAGAGVGSDFLVTDIQGPDLVRAGHGDIHDTFSTSTSHGELSGTSRALPRRKPLNEGWPVPATVVTVRALRSSRRMR